MHYITAGHKKNNWKTIQINPKTPKTPKTIITLIIETMVINHQCNKLSNPNKNNIDNIRLSKIYNKGKIKKNWNYALLCNCPETGVTEFNHLLEHVDEVISEHIRVTIQAVIDRLQGEINRFTRMNFRGYYIEYISHIYSGSKNNSEDFFPEN